jgi:hypothetical protein
MSGGSAGGGLARAVTLTSPDGWEFEAWAQRFKQRQEQDEQRMTGPDGLEISRRQPILHQRPGGGPELAKKAKQPPPPTKESWAGEQSSGAKAQQDSQRKEKEKMALARQSAPGDPRPVPVGSKRPAERDTGDPHASSKRAHTATNSATPPSSRPWLSPPSSSVNVERPPPIAPAAHAATTMGPARPAGQPSKLVQRWEDSVREILRETKDRQRDKMEGG